MIPALLTFFTGLFREPQERTYMEHYSIDVSFLKYSGKNHLRLFLKQNTTRGLLFFPHEG